MTISSFEAAYEICKLSNWTITNLKLQKILYLSHLFYLGKNKVPLFDEEFEAWLHGPVLPSLYKHVKVFGSRPITNVFSSVSEKKDSPELLFLEEKFKELENISAWDLVVMTHLKGGAWEKHFNKENRNIKIPSQDILEEYNKFYA